VKAVKNSSFECFLIYDFPLFTVEKKRESIGIRGDKKPKLCIIDFLRNPYLIKKKQKLEAGVAESAKSCLRGCSAAQLNGFKGGI